MGGIGGKTVHPATRRSRLHRDREIWESGRSGVGVQAVLCLVGGKVSTPTVVGGTSIATLPQLRTLRKHSRPSALHELDMTGNVTHMKAILIIIVLIVLIVVAVGFMRGRGPR